MSEPEQEKPLDVDERSAAEDAGAEPAPAEAAAAEPTSEPAVAVPTEEHATTESGAHPRDEQQPVLPGPPDAYDADAEQEQAAADAAVRAESARRTRRSFVVAAASVAAGYGFYRWIDHSEVRGDQPILLRRSYQANAALSRAVFRERALAPTYPLRRAENLRVNGVVGVGKELVPESWRLQVVGVANAAKRPGFVKDVTAWEYQHVPGPKDADHSTNDLDPKIDPKMDTAMKMAPAGAQGKVEQDENRTGRAPRGLAEAGESDSTLYPGTPGLLLTIDAITKLPRQELVTQFKCIEGWSQIVHWAGVRMADFLEAYPPEKVNGRDPKYVYMETPDGDYYTGYDMLVCRHPQTLLVTEMMGAPLTQLHGAPLRLHMPTKYGYKQIKRIGLIRYMDTRPDDYWTKLGYDWYAGL